MGGCIIFLVMSSVITKLPILIKFGQFLFMNYYVFEKAEL